MKSHLFLFFFCLPTLLLAQKNDQAIVEQKEETYTKKIDLSTKILSANHAKATLIEKLNFTSEEDLILLNDIDSPYGKHYTFIQTYKGFEVRLGLIKVNTDLKGNITSSFSSKKQIDFFNEPKVSVTDLEEVKLKLQDKVQTSKLVWYSVKDHFELVMDFTLLDEQGGFTERIYDAQKQLLTEIDLLHHYTDVDTTAKALVFSPNPLTSAETIYGGNYVDNNDDASPTLDGERDTVDIKITYENGMFILENEYLKLVENSLPVIPPVESATPFFFYDRSESGFEDVNVIHHITQQQDYMRSLGFTNLVDYQIHVDCHGFNGADNSAFNYGTNPPSIVFGEGGVDDAEDADVILHEYTHAIMQSASPNTNFGTQRNAMDEAFGDYMAVSYSFLYSSHHSDYAFKWDGHNEYWDGRLTVSNKIYPTDLVFNLYGDAPMWSSTLTRIERNLGRDVTMTLALEAAYSFTDNMTMAQAADVYLATDNVINNGANYSTLCWIFKDKGMVTSCSMPKPGDLVGTNEVEKDSEIKLSNTENYYLGIENILITYNGDFDITIYDLTGRTLFVKTGNKNAVEIAPNLVSANAIIIKVQTKSETKNFKIIGGQ